MDDVDDAERVVIAMASLSWAALMFSVMWQRRPVALHPFVVRHLETLPVLSAPGPIERLGTSAQTRVPVLAELGTVTVGVALGCAPLLFLADPVMGVLVVVGVVVTAGVRSISRQRGEQRLLVQQVPAFLDLLLIGLSSGLTPRLAFERVGQLVPDPLAGHVARITEQLAEGRTLAAALRSLATDDHPMRSTFVMVARAEETGAPMRAALERQLDETRRASRRELESRARRLPVLMLVPLVTCVLPAFVLVAIVPALLAQFTHLG